MQKVRQRTVSNLFKLDADSDEKIRVLMLWAGIDSDIELKVEDAKDFGDVFVLQGIWSQMNLDKVFHSGPGSMDADKTNVIALIWLMVIHRICDPESKLSCLKWLESVDVPGVTVGTHYQALLCAMDFLIENLGKIESTLASILLPLLDKDLTLAIYDLTTVQISGRGEVEGDIRKNGKSKDTGHSSRHFVLGMVQSQKGCR